MKPPKPEPWQDFSPRKRRIVNSIIRTMTKANVWVYRKTKGRIGGSFFEGARVGLLTATGRKSGKPRTVALLFYKDDDRWVVVASKGGSDRHPAWYLNLEANPEVAIEVGDTREARVARRATDEEKDEIWPELTRFYSGFDDYQSIAGRDIPVVFLEHPDS